MTTTRGRPRTLVPALAAATLLAAACSGSDDPTDLLLVTVDTLRADHVGAYGRAEARTPRMDALAADGLRFDEATTPFPRTTPALASLLTGLRPRQHGAVDVGQPLLAGKSLATALRENGFATLAVSANPVAGREQNFHRGFDVFVGSKRLVDGEHASEVTDRALSLARAVPRNQPLFLWVHYLDPHFPYDPPPEFGGAPEAPRCRALMRRALSGRMRLADVFTNRDGRSAGALADCVRLYDAEIAYVDAEFGRLIDGLDEFRDASDRLTILTSDHGENLGEEGTFFDHGQSVHDASLRIPLLVAGPGVARGVDAGVARLEDLAPTLLARLAPGTAIGGDGRDLSARLGAPASDAGDDVALAEGSRVRARCVDGLRFTICRTRNGDSELFERASDPQRTRNVADDHPDDVARLTRALERWRLEYPHQRTVRTPDFKLTEFPALVGEPRRALFDLGAEEGEDRNVRAAQPEEFDRLSAHLDDWDAAPSERARREPPPEVEAALRELGYLE